MQFSRNFSHLPPLPPPPPERQHCLIAAGRSRSCESRPRSHTFACERSRSRNYVNSHTRTGESARQVGAVKASASAAAPASSHTHTELTWKRLEVANHWQIIIQYWFAAILLLLDRLAGRLVAGHRLLYLCATAQVPYGRPTSAFFRSLVQSGGRDGRRSRSCGRRADDRLSIN